MNFKGKTILVTGGGTGIGKTIALEFARNGSSVIILGRRKSPLDEAAEEISKVLSNVGCGGTVRIFSGVDVSDEASVTSMFDTLVSEDRKVDVIINNAGVSGPVTCFSNMTIEDFKSTVDIHLTGTFWISVQALRVLSEGSKIITISTFFTEERPLEQRPYRFRTPYTASQGAKNRLSEAMSWELVDRKIMSLATNPGPVHSDRIYKTVYPKAAAEFMRVGGFETLNPVQTEQACKELVQLLGEDESIIKNRISDLAEKISSKDSDMIPLLNRLLDKVQHIAEKIQKNTSNMIVDGQFLSQQQVSQTVLSLSQDNMATILNGKVIPGDRVFYPVKPHIATLPESTSLQLNSKTVILVVDYSDMDDIQRVKILAKHIEDIGGKTICIISNSSPGYVKNAIKDDFHMHECDMSIEQISRWINAAKSIGDVAGIIHLTGNVPDASLMTMSRQQWDEMVKKFITRPAITIQSALDVFVPGGSVDPRLYKESYGRIVVIGPDLPVGKKISGSRRAQIEVFRGAQRPFTTTINQEFTDVLKSNIRSFLILPGSITGDEPSIDNLIHTVDYLLSKNSSTISEVIFTIDESRS